MSVFMPLVKSIWPAVRSTFLLTAKDPSAYYQYIGDDLFEGQDSGFTDASKPLWLNLGYWETARTYPQAATALADLVGDAAGLAEGKRLFDAGFGYGEQDFHWLRRHNLALIAGLNITPLHVERAQARVRELGLESRMDLRLGSALDIPFADASFDAVTALESAFHFDTRDAFFAEAFRVLKPGGRIGIADGATKEGVSKWPLLTRMILRRWSVPLVNMYSAAEYCRRLEAHGFVNVEARSIRNHVFPGCARYKELRMGGVPMEQATVVLSEADIADCYSLDQWELTGFIDYLIFSAEKPLAS